MLPLRRPLLLDRLDEESRSMLDEEGVVLTRSRELLEDRGVIRGVERELEEDEFDEEVVGRVSVGLRVDDRDELDDESVRGRLVDGVVRVLLREELDEVVGRDVVGREVVVRDEEEREDEERELEVEGRDTEDRELVERLGVEREVDWLERDELLREVLGREDDRDVLWRDVLWRGVDREELVREELERELERDGVEREEEVRELPRLLLAPVRDPRDSCAAEVSASARGASIRSVPAMSAPSTRKRSFSIGCVLRTPVRTSRRSDPG